MGNLFLLVDVSFPDTWGTYLSVYQNASAFIYHMISFFLQSIFSPTAFGLGARYFALYEIGGEGVHWNNLFSSPVEHDDLNLFQLWIILLVDTVLYAMIVWYVENVYPGKTFMLKLKKKRMCVYYAGIPFCVKWWALLFEMVSVD